MSVAVPTCPYCNALLDGVAPGSRVVCPRCGEAFTARGTSGITETVAPLPPPTFGPKPVGRNRAVAVVILGAMLLMAAVGLAYALVTQSVRRAHDTGLPRPRRQAQDDLAVLGYLPQGTNVALGLNWERLTESEAGRGLLRRTVRLGAVEVPVGELPAALGLDADNVRLLVLGLVVERDPLPQGVLLVRTREPIDPADHRKRLRNPRRAVAGSREVTQFDVPGLPANLSAYLTYPDERTLALSVFASNLEGIPAEPDQQFANLAAGLTELRRDVDLAAPLWLLGASDDWAKTPEWFVLGRLPESERNTLAGLRGFGVWLRQGAPDDGPVTLKATLRCRDEAAAHAVETWLLGRRRRWWTPTPDVVVIVEGSAVRYQRRALLGELRLPTER